MSNVVCERADRVMIITLNRPEVRNGLDNPTTDELVRALAELGADSSLTCGVLTGSGSGFCAGLDLRALQTDGPPRQLRELLKRRSPKPLIAAVEGFAVAGGFELALMCDLIVAARTAKLAIPEASRGLLASGGALFRLPARLALEMFLTGDVVTAEQAQPHGVIARLVEPGEALGTAIELAARIAKNAPLSIAHGRALIIDADLRREAELWERQMASRDLIFASNDAKEGALAFTEKREPNWTGT